MTLYVQENKEVGKGFLLVPVIQIFGYQWDRLQTKVREISNCSHNYVIFIENLLRPRKISVEMWLEQNIASIRHLDENSEQGYIKGRLRSHFG